VRRIDRVGRQFVEHHAEAHGRARRQPDGRAAEREPLAVRFGVGRKIIPRRTAPSFFKQTLTPEHLRSPRRCRDPISRASCNVHTSSSRQTAGGMPSTRLQAPEATFVSQGNIFDNDSRVDLRSRGLRGSGLRLRLQTRAFELTGGVQNWVCHRSQMGIDPLQIAQYVKM